MESIISTFHIDWKIIIAQAFNFGIVFTVLYIFALKPLNKLMAERALKISKGVEDAKLNADTLLATRAEYEEVITKARITDGVSILISNAEARISSIDVKQTKSGVRAIVDIQLKGE